MVVLASLIRPSTLEILLATWEKHMKKIIVLAACVLLANAAYAADEKTKVTVVKAEVKAVLSATASKPAPHPKKVSASESTVYEHSVERDGCCYTR